MANSNVPTKARKIPQELSAEGALHRIPTVRTAFCPPCGHQLRRFATFSLCEDDGGGRRHLLKLARDFSPTRSPRSAGLPGARLPMKSFPYFRGRIAQACITRCCDEEWR